MGRIARSWELVQKSAAILARHKSLMFLPVASAIASAAVSVTMLSICALAFRPEIQAFLAVRHQRPTMSQPMWIFFFVFYLVNYCIVVYFNVALVTIVSRILEGGAASISEGLQAAWERKGRIFQWALLAATVGVFLQALEERLGFLGRIAVRLFGAAWALASYFVVPVLAANDVGPVEALTQSGQLIYETWGEEVAGSFSFGLIFTILAIPGIALPFALGRNFGNAGVVSGVILMITYWVFLAIISATVQGIFNAALYRYAKTGEISSGFDSSDFKYAWETKS
jgi:Family of unknown function (DUF6159)